MFSLEYEGWFTLIFIRDDFNINDFKIEPNLNKYLLIAWKGTNLERCYLSPKFLAKYDSNCHNIS